MSKSWPLLTLAALGAIAASFLLAAFDWTAWACRLPSSEEGKVLTPGIGGCFEFWLNRYQTLFGVLAAVVAAGLAWAGVQRQIEVAAQQTSVSLVELINKRFAAARRLRTAVACVDAFEHSACDKFKDCLSSLDILQTLRSNRDEAFDMALKYDLAPMVDEYRELIERLNMHVRAGRKEVTQSIISGAEREEVEAYFTTASLVVVGHNGKLRSLERFCAIEADADRRHEGDIGRFIVNLAQRGGRTHFSLFSAFQITKDFEEKLSVLLDKTVSSAERSVR